MFLAGDRTDLCCAWHCAAQCPLYSCPVCQAGSQSGFLKSLVFTVLDMAPLLYGFWCKSENPILLQAALVISEAGVCTPASPLWTPALTLCYQEILILFLFHVFILGPLPGPDRHGQGCLVHLNMLEPSEGDSIGVGPIG